MYLEFIKCLAEHKSSCKPVTDNQGRSQITHGRLYKHDGRPESQSKVYPKHISVDLKTF